MKKKRVRNMTVRQFCNHHYACDDGFIWAINNCRTMQEAWEKAPLEWLVWIATREGVLSKEHIGTLANGLARHVGWMMGKEWSADWIRDVFTPNFKPLDAGEKNNG